MVITHSNLASLTDSSSNTLLSTAFRLVPSISRFLMSHNIHRYYAEPIVGIDLGTTNSCAALFRPGKAPLIVTNQGGRTTPSVVGFSQNKVLAGPEVLQHPDIPATARISAAKRLMGRKVADAEVQEHARQVPYQVVAHTNGDAWIAVNNQKYSPPEIGAAILRSLKEAAEAQIGTKISKAVITVPAYFNDVQRKATKAAGEIAGLEVIRVINEPTAAALSYGIDPSKNGTVAVYDLGGGTFDISILEIKDGLFEVRATNGNSHLGGEDFDSLIVQHLLDQIKQQTGHTLSSPAAIQRVRMAAEKAKCQLSTQDTAAINLPHLEDRAGRPVHFQYTLTRSQLEELIAPLIQRTLQPCRSALADAGLQKGQIDHVVVVGGMTRMPAVRQAVTDLFGKPPILGVDPDEAVAVGAAIQGGILTGQVKSVLLVDVAPLSLGIETLGGIFNRIVTKNTTIPTKRTQTFTTSEDGQTSVRIKIYEGERPLVAHNKYLGEIVLDHIPPLPKGTPQIEVTFQADANGMYTVAATNKETRQQHQITIDPAGGLTEAEIQQIIQDAAANRAQDEAAKALIEEKRKASEYLASHKESRERTNTLLSDLQKQELDSLALKLQDKIINPQTTQPELSQALQHLRQAAGKAWS
ncbi:molecular chaperone DnaK [Nematocida homosporus]|uniref:molecular chaperone DnaK n=1 Tax=Nematocida homosporus TaxID=1912981 RepID=UPI00221F630B|nr:molecular chaperone DnaK [Nematocida homosporus]KAI5185658.1 molecular chaperone DnaK [Nematocida homosporus]